MLHHKKGASGRLERRLLPSKVAGADIVEGVLAQTTAYRRRNLSVDDVIDALAAAVAGSHPGELVSVPENAPLDAHGLPIQMVYWPRSSPAGGRQHA